MVLWTFTMEWFNGSRFSLSLVSNIILYWNDSFKHCIFFYAQNVTNCNHSRSKKIRLECLTYITCLRKVLRYQRGNHKPKKDKQSMIKRKRQKEQTTIYKTLHRKLRIEQQEPHKKVGVNFDTCRITVKMTYAIKYFKNQNI